MKLRDQDTTYLEDSRRVKSMVYSNFRLTLVEQFQLTRSNEADYSDLDLEVDICLTID